MVLREMIKKIEDNDASGLQPGDYGIAVQIFDELAGCHQEPNRANPFGDARNLADWIIKEYLRLDGSSRRSMGIAYTHEWALQTIGGLTKRTLRTLQQKYSLRAKEMRI